MLLHTGEQWVDDPPPYQEGPHFTLRGLAELAIVVHNPTLSEKQAVETGDFEFAVTVKDDIIFLCCRSSEAFGWSDAPFHIHRVEPELRAHWLNRTLEPDDHLVLHMLLVNATSGIILTMRAFTLPPAIVQPLFKAINEQAKRGYNREEYNAALNSIYANLSSAQLADMAIARGYGGT